MTSRLKFILTIALAALCHPLFSQDLSVQAPKIVAYGEQFTVVFSAEGSKVSDFKWEHGEDFNLVWGPVSGTSRNFTSINGKSSRTVIHTYSYVLEAKNEGSFKLPPASAVIEGKEYTTSPLDIEVIARSSASGSSSGQSSQGDDDHADSSGDVFMTLSLNKTRAVVGEPIIATLKLYTNADLSGVENPQFPVFNGFWSQELETPQNINFVRENYNNQVYNSAVLRRYILLPQQTGDLTVDPSYMVCQIQIRTSGGGFSMFDSFFDTYQTIRKRLSTPSATIKVNPLPSGAPASFGGGVGDFTMEVKLSADSIKAHEAGSLTVEISGSGNINLIETPIVELPQDFEKYDVKTDNSFSNGTSGLSGKKVFEFPFIPRSEGLFVIPPVKYSYYSIRQGRYITLESDTLKLKVLENSNASSSGQVVSGVNKQSVVNLGSDIRYIFTSSADLAKKGHFLVASWYFAAAVIFIVLLFLVADKVLKEREKLRGDIRRTRNRRANKVARNRLKLAQSYLAKGLQAPFYEELHKALLGYVSDKLSIQFAEMQRDAIIELLDGRGIQAQDRDELISLIEECEMARYSQQQSDGAMDGQYKRAIDIISTLENKL